MKITEIQRLGHHDYTGGKDDLWHYSAANKKLFKLPGGSEYLYYFDYKPTSIYFTVGIVDPKGKSDPPNLGRFSTYQEYRRAVQKYKTEGGIGKKVIAKLSVSSYKAVPAKRPYRVGSITVDEDYCGQGLAMALYGIIINVLKISLIAGDSQTPGGRKNWLNLASIPGCEVVGYLTIKDEWIKTQKEPNKIRNFDDKRVSAGNKKAETLIDRIMMLGGEYMGQSTKYGGSRYHTFTYPVTVSGAELKNAINGSDVKLYSSGYVDDDFETGLIARWVG
jgi:hypothetical protein